MVPHVHFHIIPRVGDVPEVKARSWTVFGKGQREELDDEEAGALVEGMRDKLRRLVAGLGEGERMNLLDKEGRGLMAEVWDEKGRGGARSKL